MVTDAVFEIGSDGPQKILVCVDGSVTSMRAGAYAAGLARRQGSILLVAYVATVSPLASFDPAAGVPMNETIAQMIVQTRAELETAAKNVGIAIDFRGLRGRPYEEIVRLAKTERVDAVIVGASEHAGHRVLGSTAVRLVRSGLWPVTVVP